MPKPDTPQERAALSDARGYAHFPSDVGGGRSDEFRAGERLRGDDGGGPKAEGRPGVPHAADEIRDVDEATEDVTLVGYEEVAILEVMERFDEPALEPRTSQAELWEAVFEELMRRAP